MVSNCQSSRASEFTRERHQSVQTVRTLNVNELNKNKTKAAIIFSFKLFILSLSESGSARCLSRSRSQDSSVAPCCEQVCRMGKGTLRARWRQKGSVEISWKNDRLENCFECFQCDRPSSRGRQKLPSLTMEPKRPETLLKGDFIIFLLQNVLSCVKPVKREVVEFFADE